MDQRPCKGKGLFIVYDDLSDSTGVNKKIKNQIVAFNQTGLEVEPYLMSAVTDTVLYKLRYRLPFSNLSPQWKYSEQFDDVDFIYLRRPFFLTIWTLRFLRKLKHRNPRVKVIYELPTYPYDKEITEKKKNLPVYWKDVICRQFLHKYVDRISILGPEKEVFGIPTIQIRNGYNFDGIQLRQVQADKTTIDIAAVACFDSWHGYERLIESLYAYYSSGGTRDIMLHFVGDGPEKAHYERLVADLQLGAHVVFYGMRTYTELMDIYDKCDLGASSFGMYKIGIDYGCTLKTREYLAKGLPIISGSKLDINDIPELSGYVLNFANNDTLIDFDKVIAFNDSLYRNRAPEDIVNMANSIRDLAERNFNMQQSMMSVVKYICDGES